MASVDAPLRVHFAEWFLYRIRTREHTRKATTDTPSLGMRALRVLFHIAGFSSLSIAAFSRSFFYGMLTVGFSLFVLSALITAPKMQQKPTDELMR